MAESERRYGFREEVLNILIKMLEPFEDVTRDNMFGFPSFRASGRIFACVYESGISLKMPADASEKIVSAPGISPFIPFGRARMRQWIHIERKKAEAFIDDFSIVEASIHYVRTLPLPTGPRRKARKGATPAAKPPAAPAKASRVAKPAPNPKAAATKSKSPAKPAAKRPAGPPARAGGNKKPVAKKVAPKKAATKTPAKRQAKSAKRKPATGRAAKSRR